MKQLTTEQLEQLEGEVEMDTPCLWNIFEWRKSILSMAKENFKDRKELNATISALEGSIQLYYKLLDFCDRMDVVLPREIDMWRQEIRNISNTLQKEKEGIMLLNLVRDLPPAPKEGDKVSLSEVMTRLMSDANSENKSLSPKTEVGTCSACGGTVTYEWIKEAAYPELLGNKDWHWAQTDISCKNCGLLYTSKIFEHKRMNPGSLSRKKTAYDLNTRRKK